MNNPSIETLFHCVTCQWYRAKEPAPFCGYWDQPLVEVAQPHCLNYEEEEFLCGTLPS